MNNLLRQYQECYLHVVLLVGLTSLFGNGCKKESEAVDKALLGQDENQDIILTTKENEAVDKTPLGQDENRDIILITVDTLRADHLADWGYSRKTAPNLSRFIKEGIQYQNALAAAPWTLPSLASIHTSLYPLEHRARFAKTKIPDRFETLAKRLKKAGYYTAGAVAHEFAGRNHNFQMGFDAFDDSLKRRHASDVTSKDLTKIALAQVRKAPLGSPLFLWVHYFDPHFAYVRHPEYGFADAPAKNVSEKYRKTEISMRFLKKYVGKDAKREMKGLLEYSQAVYDEEIAFTDLWVGRLWNGIEKTRKKKKIVGCLTSDHGEYFAERGLLFHGRDLYNQLIHVPLILFGDIENDLKDKKVKQAVSLTEIPKTLVELAGITDHPFGGENLIQTARGKAESEHLFANGTYAWHEDRSFRDAIVYDGWKLIYRVEKDKYELYRYIDDQEETNDFWNKKDRNTAKVRNELKKALRAFMKKNNTTEKASNVELDKETVDRLKSLGYVE